MIINPLSSEYPSQLMDLVMRVREEVGEGTSGIGSLAGELVFLLGAIRLAQQEIPESQFRCDQILGELRAVIRRGGPDVVGYYFAKLCSKANSQPPDENGQLIQFPNHNADQKNTS